MAATIGKLSEFVPGSETVAAYSERVQLFFEANEIPESKHVAVLLSVLGGKIYTLVRNLVAPDSPKDKSYEELIEALKKHFEPKPLLIAERFHFHRRYQQAGETVAEFAAELRRLSATCEFKQPFLDEVLRDRFVCGLRSETAQKRLLTEKDLSMAKAVDIAQSLELAAANASQLQSRTRAAGSPPHGQRDVHKVTSNQVCYRCGSPNHKPTLCPCKTVRCHNCGKVGHLQRVCKGERKPRSQKKKQAQESQVRTVQEGIEDSTEHPPVLNQVSVSSAKPITVEVKLEGHPLLMEVDTGAAVSLVSEKTYRSLFIDTPLQESTASLKTYSGESIKVVGQREVEVLAEGQTAKLPLIVVAGEGPSLFGRDWLKTIRLDWKTICQVKRRQLSDILDTFKTVFEPGLGTLKGYKAKIFVDQGTPARFCKARPLPYAMRGKVEEELTRLQNEGIIESTQFADWAAPIVPVLKSDGKSLRICGDFKMTVNQASKLDRYPIPKIEDLFAKLAGGQMFTKLDMSQAYQQILLEEESQQFVVINTHQGLFRYKRLPFGVASAPGIFQRVMESVLNGIPGVTVYLDDILVTGPTEEEHLSALEKVLGRMSEAGLRLRRDKCVFLAPSVVYLGHRIDAQGLHPVTEKVKAVQEAPTPKNVTELQSYLGLLSYYSRFLPSLSTRLAPLYQLLKHDEPWSWKSAQEKAFVESKQSLLSSQVLVHFDPCLEIVLACDASAYGIGAVLSHRMLDGSEKPIGFVSRTLTEAEKNYSQIEKEGLACVFGVQRFHSYLYGHRFELVTDHKPLLTLFNEKKSIPPQASGRIQRWALKLAAYEYSIGCRSTKQHANADAMSRLPLEGASLESRTLPELVLMVERLQDAPITARQIAQWTTQDPVLSVVYQYVQQGWPDTVETGELRPYWSRRLELSSHEGCIMWGGRVVVPRQGQDYVLMELHTGHPGMSRMKALARGLVWWPGLDGMVEDIVKSCTECQQVKPLPVRAPLQPWSWPTRPWSRLHIDFAGPMDGRTFLVVVDAHTKWLEVIAMKTATALTTVQQLRTLFSKFGVPESIVSDNGPQFAAAEFQEFCKGNGIRHMRIAPYHPASNGLAERGVQTFKGGYRKLTEGTIEDRLARFLLQYRVTPHTTTGCSPAELMFGRKLRTRLDAIKPDVGKTVETKQSQQKEQHDRRSRERTLSVGNKVYVRNFGRGKPWMSGYLLRKSGPLSFMVKLSDGRVVRRHCNHLRERFAEQPVMESESDDSWGYGPTSNMSNSSSVNTHQDDAQAMGEPTRRYPSRVHQPPDRYEPS